MKNICKWDGKNTAIHIDVRCHTAFWIGEGVTIYYLIFLISKSLQVKYFYFFSHIWNCGRRPIGHCIRSLYLFAFDPYKSLNNESSLPGAPEELPVDWADISRLGKSAAMSGSLPSEAEVRRCPSTWSVDSGSIPRLRPSW